MTTATIVLIAWALFSRCAYLCFRAAHLRIFDFKASDRTFYTGVSLLAGPVALAVAGVMWVVSWPRLDRVLIHRKDSQ